MAFVRVKLLGKKDHKKEYYYLVENKRSGDNVNQKVLKYLGTTKPNDKELEDIKKSLISDEIKEKVKAPTKKIHKSKIGTTKAFSVNDELLWRSPFNDVLTKVSFRGLSSPGKAMIFTGTTQFEVELKDLDHILTKKELEDSIDKIGKEQMKLAKQINLAESKNDTHKSANLSFEYVRLNSEKDNLIFILANQKELGTTKAKPVSEKKVDQRPKSKYANINELNYKLAFEGYRNISFSPEDRAISEQNQYVEAIDSFAVGLMALVETKEQEDQATKEIQKYKETYLKKKKELLGAKSNIVSPMISGGANFPTRRNEKANNREHRLMGEFLDWNEKVKKSSRKRVINSFEGDLSQRSLDNMKKDVDRVIKWQKGIENNEEQYKGFDKRLGKDGLQGRLLRNLKNNNVELVEKSLEYIKLREKELKKPIFTSRNKVFKELELAKTRPKEAIKTGIKTVKTYKGAKIVNNFDVSRIQLEFDEIPNQTIRDNLKSNGWRFSRQNEVWQRKNTSNAIFDSKNVLDKYFDE